MAKRGATRVVLPLAFTLCAISGFGSPDKKDGEFILFEIPGPPNPITIPWGINSRGDIAGVFIRDNVMRGFVRVGNQFVTVEKPGAVGTAVTGINPQGDIVGYYFDASTGYTRGFLCRRGVYTNIDVPGAIEAPGAISTLPHGINASGDIVGTYNDSRFRTHGFLLRDGQFTTLDVPDASGTEAWGINARGDIVGRYYAPGAERAFLRRNGEIVRIDKPGAASTVANGINSQGDIVGFEVTTDGWAWAYVLRGGAFTRIVVPGSTTTQANGINSSGEIVGIYSPPGVAHAFLLTK